MMNISFVDIIEFIGTFAFAISGIRLASAKQFDLFGAYVVGLVTAIGGGTIRDLLLDVTPFWMSNTIYLVITALALLWVMIFSKYLVRMNNTFFIFDAIGLALFAVVGIQKTLDAGFPLWVATIMGTFTGAAGGVLRDVFSMNLPKIFVKHFYACASIAGAIVAFVLRIWFGALVASIAGAIVVITLRFLASFLRWNLPKPKYPVEEE